MNIMNWVFLHSNLGPIESEISSTNLVPRVYSAFKMAAGRGEDAQPPSWKWGRPWERGCLWVSYENFFFLVKIIKETRIKHDKVNLPF